MSRVGKLPVALPEGVQVELGQQEITIKGKLGELKTAIHPLVTVKNEDNALTVTPANETKAARSMWGTLRSVLSNMVQGVSDGYTIRLEINGVGYKANTDGKILTLALGFSHDIKYAVPMNIDIKCEKPTLLVITGANKQLVGQVAGELMAFRPVEPYKGKGVYIEGSYVRRKEGKKK